MASIPVVMAVVVCAIAATIALAPDTIVVSIGFTLVAALMTHKTLPRLRQTFVNARLSGTDILKPNRPVLYVEITPVSYYRANDYTQSRSNGIPDGHHLLGCHVLLHSVPLYALV